LRITENQVQTIQLNKLVSHPDNPNKQSKVNFDKLVRNIERTGKYEPLIVRRHPTRKGYFQLINGHHRCKALGQLGYKQANVIVWDVDDEQTDILLATLNRLGGNDELGKKLTLLKRLNETFQTKELAKLLPQTSKQIEQLVNLRIPTAPAADTGKFLNPLVFFITDEQKQIIEDMLSFAEDKNDKPKGVRRASALVRIAQFFKENEGVKDGKKEEAKQEAACSN
jgi:ParB/RepB/Spo0J family partition protein